jgi:hypothetical protein
MTSDSDTKTAVELDAFQPNRAGCALSLREILLARSQRARLASKFVPQDPHDEPVSALLDHIRDSRPQMEKI